MSIDNIINILLGLGSVSGLIVLPYSIIQARKRKPRIKYDFSGKSGKNGRCESNIQFYDFLFSGTIKNWSIEVNSITKIYLVVWLNDKKNSVLRYGYGGTEVYDKANKNNISLPLQLKPKEAISVTIRCEIPLTGTQDERLISKLIPLSPTSKFLYHKYDYELCFEDVEENIFDETGNLINIEEINLRWTLPNTMSDLQKGNINPFLKHMFKIYLSNLKFTIKKIKFAIGL